MKLIKVIGLIALGAVIAMAVVFLIPDRRSSQAQANVAVAAPDRQDADVPTDVVEDEGAVDVAIDPSATTIAIPHRYRFGDIDRVEVAENTDQLLGRYHGEELEYLIGYYHGFTPVGSGFDVLDFHNREQMRWLVENGYPMPEEVLEARRVGKDELLALSRQGNTKAQMFYVDLTAATLGNPSREDGVGPEQMLAGSEWIQTVDKVVASGSPFAGYVAAKAKKESGKRYGVAAAYRLAQTLGDSRAQAAVDLVSAEGADANVELAQFHGMLMTLSQGTDLNRVFRSGDPGFPAR